VNLVYRCNYYFWCVNRLIKPVIVSASVSQYITSEYSVLIVSIFNLS